MKKLKRTIKAVGRGKAKKFCVYTGSKKGLCANTRAAAKRILHPAKRGSGRKGRAGKASARLAADTIRGHFVIRRCGGKMKLWINGQAVKPAGNRIKHALLSMRFQPVASPVDTVEPAYEGWC